MMNPKIYVGNLGFTISNKTLTIMFAKYGRVRSAKIVTNHETNQSKGFAFVEMSSGYEAEVAIMRLNGTNMDGRTIKVSAAKPLIRP